MKYKDYLKQALISVGALIWLASAEAVPVTWNGWRLNYEVSVDFGGLVLTHVNYHNHSMFKRIGLHSIGLNGIAKGIPGTDLGCQDYSAWFDYTSGNLSPMPWANNASVSQRQFWKDGREWYEIGVYKIIQSREYFQAYYLSKDGLFDAHLYSRGGWLCPERSYRSPLWRIDADIDGDSSDVIETFDSKRFDFSPRTIEFSEVFSNTSPFYSLQLRDLISATVVPISFSGLNFNHPDGQWTQPTRVFGQKAYFENDFAWGTAGILYHLGDETNIIVDNENIYGKDIVVWLTGRLSAIFDYNETPELISQTNWYTNSILFIPSWAQRLPDVAVDEIDYKGKYTPASNVGLGDMGRFTITVRNLGAATPVDKPVGVGIYIDGIYRTYVAVKSLRPGEIRTLTTTDLTRYIIPGGEHTITAWVDDLNRFAESYENNNTLNKQVSIPLGPALRITAPALNSTVSGASVVLSARASDPSGIKGGVNFYIDSRFIGNKWTFPYTLTWDSRNTAEGWHTFIALASGNSSSASGAGVAFKVARDPSSFPPDISVTSLDYANGVFTTTIQNIGTGAIPTGGWLGVSYYVDGVYKTWTQTFGPLAPGESKTLSMLGSTYEISPGNHTIKVIADDQASVAESNETNNQLTKVITVP